MMRSLKVQINRKSLKRKQKQKKDDDQEFSNKVKWRLKRKNTQSHSFENTVDYLHSLIERPVRFLCKMTIPASEKEKWHRGYASCNPFCGLVLILIAIDRK